MRSNHVLWRLATFAAPCAAFLSFSAVSSAAQESFTGTCYQMSEVPPGTVAANNNGDLAILDPREGLRLYGSATGINVPLHNPSQNHPPEHIWVAGMSDDGKVAFNVQNNSTGSSQAFVGAKNGQTSQISVPDARSVHVRFISPDGMIVGGGAQTEPYAETSWWFIAFLERGNTWRIFSPPSTAGSRSSAASMNGTNVVVDGSFPSIFDLRRNRSVPILSASHSPSTYSHFFPRFISRDGQIVAGLASSFRQWPSSYQVMFARRSSLNRSEFDVAETLPSFEGRTYSMQSTISKMVGNHIVGSMGPTVESSYPDTTVNPEAFIYTLGERFSRSLQSLLCEPALDLQLIEAIGATPNADNVLVRGRTTGGMGPTGGYQRDAVFILKKDFGLSLTPE
jgi:hypothetical protein